MEILDLSSPTPIAAFLAFGALSDEMTVGVTDLNGDGRADIIVGAASGGPVVEIISGETLDIAGAFFMKGPGKSGKFDFGAFVGGSV